MQANVCGIYCIENISNGNKYIGYAKDIRLRWINHRCCLKNNRHSNTYLQNSYNKYGEDYFKYYILQEINSVELLKDMEIYWIAYYDAYVLDGGGFNMTRGGDGIASFTHSDESKKIMSENNKGSKNPFYGKHHSEESKKRNSENQPDFFGENNPMFGKPRTNEDKEKISMANTGKKLHKNTSSSHVGVYYQTNKNKWQARITIDKNRVHLGFFDTEKEAILAYDIRDFFEKILKTEKRK